MAGAGPRKAADRPAGDRVAPRVAGAGPGGSYRHSPPKRAAGRAGGRARPVRTVSRDGVGSPVARRWRSTGRRDAAEGPAGDCVAPRVAGAGPGGSYDTYLAGERQGDVREQWSAPAASVLPVYACCLGLRRRLREACGLHRRTLLFCAQASRPRASWTRRWAEFFAAVWRVDLQREFLGGWRWRSLAGSQGRFFLGF